MANEPEYSAWLVEVRPGGWFYIPQAEDRYAAVNELFNAIVDDHSDWGDVDVTLTEMPVVVRFVQLANRVTSLNGKVERIETEFAHNVLADTEGRP